MQSENRVCQNCKCEFLIDQADFNFYEMVKVPAPTFCSLCRAQRRMAWRNESSLFKRKSDYSGKEIFSAFSPDSPVKVYEKDGAFLAGQTSIFGNIKINKNVLKSEQPLKDYILSQLILKL